MVGALVRLTRGTAGPDRAVAEVVRARLQLMPEGARALAAIEAGPADPRARGELTAAVAQLLATDPGFAQYLTTTELGGPADPTTVQLRTDPEPDPTTVHLRVGPEDRSTVQLRVEPRNPSTVQLRVDPAAAGARALAARRSNTALVVALALVLIAALVALGIHLGSRPLLQPTGPDFAHAARTVRDPAQAQGVLPDLTAMPSGWQVASGPRSGASSGPDVPCLLPGACDQQLAYATVTFSTTPLPSVQFTVVTFTSAEAAGRAFDTRLDLLDARGDATVATVPSIGDRSAARTRGGSTAETLVRVDSVLLYVHYSGPGATVALPGLTPFARLLAERAQQAEQGRTPDAVFHATAP
ncbi:hypothetical protein HS99_0021380 [Kitasatospora aureofaciens]|uniref:Uncharacterized protein n=1 Tax=Kitasatospora aureofaciens TaxID=1894 RepID=A0A1E7NCP8_KITAU|nr:hypothetical protein HS99_0021380 [Kitasatospora aureofaciens]